MTATAEKLEIPGATRQHQRLVRRVARLCTGDTLTSVAFPGLQLAIDTLFEE